MQPRLRTTPSLLTQGRALHLAVFLVLMGAITARAQMPLQADDPTLANTVTPPVFEVASVKENKGPGDMMRIMSKPNGFQATNLPLKDIIAQAYGIRQDLISGLPDWANTLRFDIDAKVADEDVSTLKRLSPRQRAGMLIPLLAERFKLQVHKEVRTLPTYDLVVEKGGPKLKASTAVPLPPNTPMEKIPTMQFAGRVTMGPDRFSGTGVPIRTLTNQLAYIVHRTVADRTGLTDKYDVDIKWTPQEKADAGTDDQAGSIFTVLSEQLGLKLVSSKGPVDTIVVDHVEKPSEN